MPATILELTTGEIGDSLDGASLTGLPAAKRADADVPSCP